MTRRTVSIGIIGTGRIGRIHARNVARSIPGTRLQGLADADKRSVEACAAEFGVANAGTEYRRVIEDEAVEAVVVCSPTDTHARIVIEAAEAGKHIFCEKPIDLKLARIDEVLEAVARNGVTLHVGFNRRFDANARRIRAAVCGGEIGEPHRIHIVSRDPGPPPASYLAGSGGMFLDMTIHDFDMARFLIGQEVEEVYTTAAVRIDPDAAALGDVDTAVVVLKFADGTIGTIDNSRKAVYGYDQRIEVFGSGGSIRSENRHPDQTIVSGPDSVRRGLPLHFFLERYAESFLLEMEAFADVVREGGSAPVTGEDGRISVVMALAARRSYDENRPVRLDEITA